MVEVTTKPCGCKETMLKHSSASEVNSISDSTFAADDKILLQKVICPSFDTATADTVLPVRSEGPIHTRSDVKSSFFWTAGSVSCLQIDI